ncbi:MAG: hypothetical protein Q9185_006262 [Variospora sp. 1 TL-2023]
MASRLDWLRTCKLKQLEAIARATGTNSSGAKSTLISNIHEARFRSMGGSSVQEWTLRVNMFEAMLYAVLQTLRATGQWRGEVLPVEPSKVARFWVGGVEGKGKGEKTKKRKMAVARELVGGGESVRVKKGEEGVREVMTAGKGRGGKFDDLADSLLQGLAWVRWEENKRAVLEKGADVLGEFGARS